MLNMKSGMVDGMLVGMLLGAAYGAFQVGTRISGVNFAIFELLSFQSVRNLNNFFPPTQFFQ